MSEDFLKNPLSLFDVKGKTAIVTGATGAFGAHGGEDLGGSRRHRRPHREQRGGPEKGRRRVRPARRQGRNGRQATELRSQLRRHRRHRGRKIRRRRHPGGSLGPEQGGEDRRSKAGGFSRRDGRQCHAILADGARRRQADDQAGPRRQDHPDVLGARSPRPSGRLHRLLRVEVCHRRHHQGAWLRARARPASRSMQSARPFSARR